MRSFLAALAFLTIVPIRFRAPLPDAVVAGSRLWYPIVGLLLGAFLGLIAYGLDMAVSPLLTAFLVLVIWVAVTGALHLDGLADTCDGLFGGHTPEERLKIMRDPRVGTFGMVGCVLLLLGKLVILQELATRVDPMALAVVLGAGVFVARSSILVMAGLAPYARPEGTGKLVIEAATWRDAAAAVLLSLGVCFLLSSALEWLVALSAAGAVLLCVTLLSWICRRRLGGVTGDCLGAAVELAELTFLLVYVLMPLA